MHFNQFLDLYTHFYLIHVPVHTVYLFNNSKTLLMGSPSFKYINYQNNITVHYQDYYHYYRRPHLKPNLKAEIQTRMLQNLDKYNVDSLYYCIILVVCYQIEVFLKNKAIVYDELSVI